METDERRWERRRPQGVERSRVSAAAASGILLLHWIADGAGPNHCTALSDVFTMRPEAFQASVLGQTLKGRIPAAWLETAQSLDYAKAKRPNGI